MSCEHILLDLAVAFKDLPWRVYEDSVANKMILVAWRQFQFCVCPVLDMAPDITNFEYLYTYVRVAGIDDPPYVLNAEGAVVWATTWEIFHLEGEYVGKPFPVSSIYDLAQVAASPIGGAPKYRHLIIEALREGGDRW